MLEKDSLPSGYRLTPEEDFLWQCARHWRNPSMLEKTGPLNWDIVVEIGLANRMQTLLFGILGTTCLKDNLSSDSANQLKKWVARHEYNAQLLGDALRQYLQHAVLHDHEVVVIKGLWLSEIIYGQSSMRPGADIDLLVRRSDIPLSLTILEDEMGFGTWWRPLLDDRYYQRHHLHQQRCNHDRSIWIEPHWLLDHPYTQFTIDYNALLNRSKPGRLWGLPVQELSPPDQLLVLSIHLVKHAVYLPSVVDRGDMTRLILADNMLLYYLDVAEVVGHYQKELDWDQVAALAQETGTAGALGSVLKICHDQLAVPVPDSLLSSLSVTRPNQFTKLIMSHLADAKISKIQGQKTNKIWSFLLGYNSSIVFRPIRLLDLIHFMFPGGNYLERRYGGASLFIRATHLIKTAGRYMLVGWDTLYFSLKRKIEVWKLDRQGFAWPELPLLDE
ncbi:MAG TPA: nucleotidyltransferase family protein [candidate division Zixibacteria bacterium]|nr:nucleotidyltransferase family protein [candidate division Zixibacteria bacterium]